MRIKIILLVLVVSVLATPPPSISASSKTIPGIEQSSGAGGDFVFASSFEQASTFDIVYVRYPDPGEGVFVNIPQGEKPYRLAEGADLVLLKPDGSEIILVDCAECSVMDPFISYDGKTVYYSYNEKVESPNRFGDPYQSWIFKIRLDDPLFTPIRMTYDDGFDSALFSANRNVSGDVRDGHDQSDRRAIRDMSPVPLADGRLLFVSNRAALTTFHPYTDAAIDGSIQLMYVMDDHDGTAVTKELANIQLLETGNIHLVQHPTQLMDGRILFSTWQDAGTKSNGAEFRYAMTTLFTIHPDGSNLRQFTEPHDHRKRLDHFISQLSGGDIVWAYYYPSFDYGFGLIMRSSIDPPGIDFLRGSVQQRFPWGNQYRISNREFDRNDMVTITPHTTGSDTPAPDRSGKYSMPSTATNGDLLVAYSTGSVNWFNAACASAGLCESLKSGIYMIKNADGDEDDYIMDPTTDLVLIKDDPNYNEIWPRAVLSYQQIYGQATPDIINNLAISPPDDSRLLAGEATALVGTSSIYNREPLNEGNPDRFDPSNRREFHDGNWTVQGADAGAFTNSDIYGVRIVATPPIPFTEPINRNLDTVRWNAISRHLLDDRLRLVVARFGAEHGEKWEILGEFPVKKTTLDLQGNPDTSWLAKVPADTPFFIQTIDDKGMTLVSEITWRALKSGEKRADCGGCHAHSIPALDIASTAAGTNQAITNIPGIADNNEIIADGIWDLTQNSIPLLSSTGVELEPGYSYGVEFNRDVVPILNSTCISCHTTGGSGSMFILDGTGGEDAWEVISRTDSSSYTEPQMSRYIRTPQARQSLFVWAAWGERLDGRLDSTRDDDINYPVSHPALSISDIDKRTIARWVDLGSPIDFPTTDGMGYTDDYQLPVLNISTPRLGSNSGSELKVGFADAKSGINWSTLSVSYFELDAAFFNQLPDPADTANITANIAALKVLIASLEQSVSVNLVQDVNAKNILTVDMGLSAGEYIVTVTVNDNTGNTAVASRRFLVN